MVGSSRWRIGMIILCEGTRPTAIGHGVRDGYFHMLFPDTTNTKKCTDLYTISTRCGARRNDISSLEVVTRARDTDSNSNVEMLHP